MIREADFVIVGTNHQVYAEEAAAALRESGPTVVADIWNLFGTGQVVFQAPDALRAP